MGEFIGGLFGTGLGVIFRNKRIGIMSALLIIFINILGIAGGNFAGTFIFTIILLFVIGIVASIVLIPWRGRVRKYEKVFEGMAFRATNGECPKYLGETDSGYAKVVGFTSLIPLEIWLAKKSLLETHLNARIIKIENAPNDNNVVCVYIELKALPEVIPWEDCYSQPQEHVLSVGMDYEGIIIIDLEKSPHCFVAGETGSGKSNLLKGLIYQCLEKQIEVKLIDFKRGVSFSEFSDHFEIFFEYEKIIIVLEQLVKETNRRLDLLVKNKVENMGQYNAIAPKEKEIKRIVVFIDELAELIRAGDKETNKKILNCLETLTRISRAAGVNLIMGIQRPDSTVITGQIKSNVTTRICGRFVDPEPSRIMLGSDKVMELPDTKGRFILKNNGFIEFQAFYITRDTMTYLMNDEELEEWNNREIEEDPDEQDNAQSWETVKTAMKEQENRVSFNFDDIQI